MNPQDKIERLRLALVALKEAANAVVLSHYNDEYGAAGGTIRTLDARQDDAQSALEDCGYG